MLKLPDSLFALVASLLLAVGLPFSADASWQYVGGGMHHDDECPTGVYVGDLIGTVGPANVSNPAAFRGAMLAGCGTPPGPTGSFGMVVDELYYYPIESTWRYRAGWSAYEYGEVGPNVTYRWVGSAEPEDCGGGVWADTGSCPSGPVVCWDGSEAPTEGECPYECPDGSAADDESECPVAEANCAPRSGQIFTTPDYLRRQHGPGYSSQGQKGWMYGCEFSVYNCDGSSCMACFTGNGTVNKTYDPPVRWSGATGIGGGTSCIVSDDPQPHPGFCSPTASNYDARTDSCSGGDVTMQCDDPAYDGVSACQMTFPDEETGEPVYNPPAPTTPVIPEEDFDTPPVTTPPVTTPPVGEGINPGYTGENPPGEGQIGNGSSGVPQVNGSTGHTGGAGGGSTEDTGSVSWGNLPAIDGDGFYTRQYEGGLSGVFAERMGEMQDTPIFEFASQFSVPNGTGAIPSWEIDLTSIGFGKIPLTFFQAEWAWKFVKWVIIISTFFLCRRIIFGA